MKQLKKNTPFLLFILGITLAGIFIASTTFFKSNTTTPQEQNHQQTTTHTESTTEPPAPSGPQDPSPDTSAIYIGSYKNKDVLFYNSQGDSFKGNIVNPDGSQVSDVDYRTMDNIQILYTPTGKLYSVVNFQMTQSKNFLYVSVLIDDATLGAYPDSLVNKVYRIAMVNLTGSEVWTNNLKSNKYNIKGAASVVGVGEERAVALSLAECYACEGQEIDTLVVSTRSKADIRLGRAGDFVFNISNNAFTYRKKQPISESCTGGPGCQNGKRTVYKTTGETLSVQIP